MTTSTSKWNEQADAVDMPLWSEIMPNLWLGGTSDKDWITSNEVLPEVTQNDFDFVVTAFDLARTIIHEPSMGNAQKMFAELRVPFWDTDVTNVPVQSIKMAASAAYNAWQNNQRVLIRCQMGLNRSGIIMALVLMRHGMTATQAIAHMRNARSPYVLSNRSFAEWLATAGTKHIQKKARKNNDA